MRLKRMHLHVNRQHERIVARVALARRDVEILPSEPEHRRRPFRRIVAEEEPDRRLHELGLAARLHVEFHDEIRSGLQRPRQALRQERRSLTGCPAEEVPIGVTRRMRDQPVVAGRRILVVEPPRRRRAIDADVGVVHDAVAGTKLERADEAPLGYRQRDRRRSGRHRSLPSSSVYGGGRTTRSGTPSCQPPLAVGSGGRSLALPFVAPSSAHF